MCPASAEVKEREKGREVMHDFTDLEICLVEWSLILQMPLTQNVNCRPD